MCQKNDWIGIAFIVSSLCASPAALAAEPASAPASQPARDAAKIALDTPEKAASAYAMALRDGTVESVRLCLRLESAQDKASADAIVRWVATSSHLHNTALKRFGKDGADAIASGSMLPPANAQGVEMLENLKKDENAHAKVTGDHAMMELDPVGELQFAKVGADWKIYFDYPSAAEADEASKNLARVSEFMESLSKNIEAGKFAKASDVVAAESGGQVEKPTVKKG